MKQHLGRQSGVQNVEVSLIDGKVQVMPKEDGQIDPAQLMKATYDSGVSVAEMDIVARGKIVKDAAGNFALQVEPNRSFVFEPNDLSKEPRGARGFADDGHCARPTVQETARKKEGRAAAAPLKLLILEIQKKE